MGIFANLFSSNKAIDAIIDTGDALVFTDEEKRGAFAKMLKLYEPFKIAQRLIALMTGIPFVILHVLFCVVDVVVILNGGERLMGEMAQINNETLGEPFGWIVIFYFAGGAVEGGGRAVIGALRK
jgi:hypothetical protein